MDPSVSHGYGISPEHILITLSDTLYHALTIIGKNPSLYQNVASVLIATASRNPVDDTYGFPSCSLTVTPRISTFTDQPVTFRSVLVTPFAVERLIDKLAPPAEFTIVNAPGARIIGVENVATVPEYVATTEFDH